MTAWIRQLIGLSMGTALSHASLAAQGLTIQSLGVEGYPVARYQDRLVVAAPVACPLPENAGHAWCAGVVIVDVRTRQVIETKPLVADLSALTAYLPDYGVAAESQSRWLIFPREEAGRGDMLRRVDLNDDGDTDDVVLQILDIQTGEAQTIHLALYAPPCRPDAAQCVDIGGGWLLFSVCEAAQGNRDLNGDGDTEDQVLHVRRLATGETRNLGIAACADWGASLCWPGDHMVGIADGGGYFSYWLETGDWRFSEDEELFLSCGNRELRSVGFSGRWSYELRLEDREGVDWNEDGDLVDQVLFAMDRESGETWYAGETSATSDFEFTLPAVVLGRWLAFPSPVYEFLVHDLLDRSTQRVAGYFAHATLGRMSPYELTRVGDWLVWAEPAVGGLRGWNGRTGDHWSWMLGNPGLSVSAYVGGDKWSAFALGESWTEEAVDLNADGDVDDVVLHLITDSVPSRFLRGDPNADATLDISDPVRILGWLFLGTPDPECLAAADANGDAAIDISDASYLLAFLFLGGPPPLVPFPECGEAGLASDAGLGCAAPPGCP